MNLVKKWKLVLEYTSDKIEAVPENEWERVAELLEFSERATLGKEVPDWKVEELIKEERENNGYYYQTHTHWGDNWAKIDVPYVRKNYKTLTLDDLFARYL